MFCRCLGARKLGHMAVLCTREGEDGRTELACIAGPFWPFTMCVTMPLILVISGLVAVKLLGHHAPFVIVIWLVTLLTMITFLLLTGCSDPGILRRYGERPTPGSHPVETNRWRWSDQAQTYRPPGASYDSDCGVIIEGFDHVCPWTGTGIGAANMAYFQTFVCCLCVCIVIDIALAVGVVAV